MKDPLEMLAFVAAELVNDEKVFNDAKSIGTKMLSLLEAEAVEYSRGTVLLAIYIVVYAFIDAEKHIKQLN